jgi:hypothetical protein
MKTLTGIYDHLVEGGRFICTLQNPLVRREMVDGQLRLWRKRDLGDGKLLVWGLQTLDSDGRTVSCEQFFEEYDDSGVMRRRTLLELAYRLTESDEFAELARSAGFRVVSLYGGYSHSAFQQDASPDQVWVLEKPVWGGSKAGGG